MKYFLKKNQILLDFISDEMIKRQLTLSIAESCTGGFVSSCFTSKAGSSKYFKGSMVAYSNDLKTKFLNIKSNDIKKFGVASEFIVRLMAEEIRNKYSTNFGFATTGYVDYMDDVDELYAWIAVASQKEVFSECVLLTQNRLENIEFVSHSLLNLFRKEIL